jgi:hypothetical protein
LKTSPATDSEDLADTAAVDGSLTALAWLCGLLLAAILLLLVGAFVYSAFYASLLSTLRDGARLATFLGNLLVVFYAFPAFIRTKDRAFLCIAAAALAFGYGGLFSILFTIGPPATTAWHMSHSEAHWYYVARYTIDIVGLVLYTYGIVSLSRRAKPKA